MAGVATLWSLAAAASCSRKLILGGVFSGRRDGRRWRLIRGAGGWGIATPVTVRSMEATSCEGGIRGMLKGRKGGDDGRDKGLHAWGDARLGCSLLLVPSVSCSVALSSSSWAAASA
jgi:hypothetical protein